jgi:fimbrial chaperone protein
MSRFGIKAGIQAFGFACCVAFLAGRAQASSIEISPVRVNLSAKARVAVLTVHNAGEDETVMQVSLMHWPATESVYAFEPTGELLVTPTTFRLAGGAQQIVRVGLRGPVPAQTEAAYRLIIEEVPALQEQDTTRMRLVVRHDLPVFVAPAVADLHQVHMAMDCGPNGAGLQLRNVGNSHLKVLRMALMEPASGKAEGDWKTFEYLLPGALKRWLLTTVAPDAKASAYVATAYTEQGTFSADVQNPCR